MDAKARKIDGGVCVSSLPEDIVFDVLARLPTKPLCRFRCVCKRWRALISDPAFIAAQRPSAAADPHLVGVFLRAGNLPEVRVMDMDGKVVSAFFKITRNTAVPLKPQLPSWPDLICADGGNRPRQHGDMIIAPAAGQAFAAFFGKTNPASSTVIGRAAPSGVFKVLRVQESSLMDGSDGSGHQIWKVATIMDGSSASIAAETTLTWRLKSAPPFVINQCSREDHRTIANGVVYFIHELVIVDEDGCMTLTFDYIVAFDLESEEWMAEPISGPPLVYGKDGDIWSTFSLVELKGTLGLVHDYDLNEYLYTDIWLLVDPDKSVWVKEYTKIPIPKKHMPPTRPLGVLVDGRILLLSSVWENDGRDSVWENEGTCRDNTNFTRPQHVVLFYDPSTKAFADFIEMAEGFTHTLIFYTGSLIS